MGEFNKFIGMKNHDTDCSNVMKQVNAINLSVMVNIYLKHNILYSSSSTGYIH